MYLKGYSTNIYGYGRMLQLVTPGNDKKKCKENQKTHTLKRLVPFLVVQNPEMRKKKRINKQKAMGEAF